MQPPSTQSIYVCYSTRCTVETVQNLEYNFSLMQGQLPIIYFY